MANRSTPIDRTGHEAPIDSSRQREQTERRQRNPTNSACRPCNPAGGTVASSSKQSSISTWRRPAPRVARPYQSDSRVHSIFYGYSAELISHWCSVSRATADSWKAGRTKPTRQALKLFNLYANEQVLTPEFRGFRIRKATIVDPQNQVLSRSNIEGYHHWLQFAAEAAKASNDPAMIERYFALMQKVS